MLHSVVRFPFFPLFLSLSLSRARVHPTPSLHRTQEVALGVSLFFSLIHRPLSLSLFLSSSLPTTPVSLLLAPLSFRSIFLLLSSFRHNPATFGTRFHSFTWARQPARASAIATSFGRLIETFVFPCVLRRLSKDFRQTGRGSVNPLVRSHIFFFFYRSSTRNLTLFITETRARSRKFSKARILLCRFHGIDTWHVVARIIDGVNRSPSCPLSNTIKISLVISTCS